MCKIEEKTTQDHEKKGDVWGGYIEVGEGE
jgi:hypothetical protein